MRILALVNTLNAVNSFIYSNHIAFWCYNKKALPEVEFKFFTPPRMSIDMARNTAAKCALENECDYLLFIDDDVLVPEWTLPCLLAAKADITAGLVIIRGYPFNVMAFKKDGDSIPYFNDLPKVTIKEQYASLGMVSEDETLVLKDLVTQDDGLVAVGFSCCLISTNLLKKVNPPYFITGPRNTEDIYFCMKARDTIESLREHDPSVEPLKISMVTSVQCGHFLHAEPIEYRTIDIFKQLYESLDPLLEARDRENLDLRDLTYIQKNMSSL